MGPGVKKVDVGMNEHEHAAVVVVSLDKSFVWVEVFGPVRVYPVC